MFRLPSAPTDKACVEYEKDFSGCIFFPPWDELLRRNGEMRRWDCVPLAAICIRRYAANGLASGCGQQSPPPSFLRARLLEVSKTPLGACQCSRDLLTSRWISALGSQGWGMCNSRVKWTTWLRGRSYKHQQSILEISRVAFISRGWRWRRSRKMVCAADPRSTRESGCPAPLG